jgi:ribosomal protein S18 acetylase RimI-like enzyme
VTSPAVHVRRATHADAAALAETIVAAFQEYRGVLVPESGALRETAESIAAELENGAGALVAEREGQVLGCVMTKSLDGDLYLGRLSVLPAARRCGLARLLVSVIENHAQRDRAPATRLNVRVALPENQRFFASLGYVEIGREAHAGFAQPTFIVMRKAFAYCPAPI